VKPITFAFQWRRDTVNISGATNQTYSLQVADEGTTVDCVVTATNDEGSDSATANGVSVTASFSDGLLLESGDRLLLESGDFILLEAA
jgi:urease accessory protein UreE